MTLLMDALQKALHSQPVHIHQYEPLAGTGGPPRLDTAVDPHIEIYLDGSGDRDGDERLAGWAFIIVANVPLHLGQPIAIVDGNNYIVFKRYGGVITRTDADRYIGATRKTNNTGEISAFIEAMMFVLFETTIANDYPMTFVFDSLLSGSQTMGHWNIADDSVNVELARRLSTPSMRQSLEHIEATTTTSE